MLDEWKISTTFLTSVLITLMIYVETTGPLVTQPDYLVTLDDFTFERRCGYLYMICLLWLTFLYSVTSYSQVFGSWRKLFGRSQTIDISRIYFKIMRMKRKMLWKSNSVKESNNIDHLYVNKVNHWRIWVNCSNCRSAGNPSNARKRCTFILHQFCSVSFASLTHWDTH